MFWQVNNLTLIIHIRTLLIQILKEHPQYIILLHIFSLNIFTLSFRHLTNCPFLSEWHQLLISQCLPGMFGCLFFMKPISLRSILIGHIYHFMNNSIWLHLIECRVLGTAFLEWFRFLLWFHRFIRPWCFPIGFDVLCFNLSLWKFVKCIHATWSLECLW